MPAKTGDRTAAGCLALFALPFAAVGVGALYFALGNVSSWASMSRWVAVPAQLLSLDLAEHAGDDSTTYEVRASYRYSLDGRDYASERVAISRMADNIGSFQRDLYDELRSAQKRGGGRVTAYVDPASPASATLNRDLRWPLVALECAFALVFGGAGFGLAIGGRIGFKRRAAEREQQALHPGEPWRWRADWTDGKIRSSARAAAYGAAGFAALWNAIAIPTGIFVWPEIVKGNYAALVGLLFPLVGAGLLVWAVRAWLRVTRFKGATLALQRVPVAVGGRLQGAIRVDGPVAGAKEFRIEVSCVERQRSGGRDRETRERIAWQNRWTVPRSRCEMAPTYSSIPLDFPIPQSLPATTVGDEAGNVSWRVDASAECAGPDFWMRFEVPVFDLSVAAMPDAASAGSDATDAHEVSDARDAGSRPDALTLASLGIVYEQLPQGGESWTFRRAQHKAAAATVTAIAAVFGACAAGLWIAEAPLIIALAFAAFAALFVWFALDLWFTEYRVTLDRGLLTIAKRGLAGARAPVQIPRQWVKSIRAQRGMQSGEKLYYDLRVETAEESLTAASAVADYNVASWLASYWQHGGEQRA